MTVDLGSDETPTNPGLESMQDALVEFTGAIGNALTVCSYGLTIGETYVPFDPDPEDDCEEDEVQCSQAWVRVMDVSPKPGGIEGWEGESCTLSLQMQLEAGVLRCLEIPEDGEAPTATEVLEAAMIALDDMNAILCAALSTEVWDSIAVGTWTPYGPLGGQFGGTWTFTVDVA